MTPQVGELHRMPVLDHHRTCAAPDLDPEPVPGIDDIKHGDVTKTHQQFTLDNRIGRQEKIPNLDGF